MKNGYTKDMAIYGMFIALAMVFSYIESMIPISLGIPGIKLGIANLVTIVCLYVLGIKAAISVSLIRIVLMGLSFGNTSTMMYALAGGMLSLLLMIIAKKADLFSMAGVSIIGGVSHNIGQLILAAIIIETVGVISYMPVLLFAGSVAGFLIGICAAIILKRIKPEFKK